MQTQKYHFEMSDKLTIVWAVVGLLGLALVCFTVLGAIAFVRADKGTAVSFGLLFQRGNFLRLGTVALIVLAVILLALEGILNSEATATILSGVAGYVLGGLDRQSSTSKTNPKETNP